MIRYVVPLVGLLAIGGCTQAQIDSVFTTAKADQAKIETAIGAGCAGVNAAAAVAAPFSAVPQIAALLGFATASCATAPAVAALVTKAVNDPSTELWVQQLAAQINSEVMRVKGG